MLTEQFVRETIQRHITKTEDQIEALLHMSDFLEVPNQKSIQIEKLECAHSALIHLQHDLRLCDCPDEAYSQKAKG